MFENAAQAQSSDNKTSLVEHLRSTIESGGAQAATTWFQENWPADKSEYAVDSQALMSLMSEYMGTGDSAAAQAVAEITATVMRDTMTDAMNTHAPGMAAEMEAMREAEAEQQLREQAVEQKNNSQIEQQSRGKSRDDLSRFKGLYGEAGGRQIFVSESCDGFMVAGPMWADVSAWWMRPATDNVFTYSDSFISLAFDFKLDEKGQAVELIHDLDGVPSPMLRTGNLPAAFSNCIERPTR